ncbi:MBL fold metallo-hydrolase [Shimia abyssi]|uniref:Glyoxylase-like metal-dependent hydrolase (Beta-lactamase superfamily II) n=1 Tax=Shimia abyssi TaxID=1662395 RepID=A0A2P8FH21_9RHOB|nr:MBL fold metallo-hydrolase [Shimia abyssi]PSL20950.1 glyoxylase-like metal-dependent hydrolase (beta-lactamase superfamily II) [Shimia abyssi]
MTSLKMTRRSFSFALAGVTAGAAFPSTSFAAEVATITVGDKTISMLSDGHFDIPPAFFTDADDAALAAAGNPIEIGATVWLIQTVDRRILVDTGSGQALAGMFPTVGKLDALLTAEGIEKADITDIVLTHMHADHIGGLLGEDAGGFSNAAVHVSQAEWGFWTNPSLLDATPESDKPMIGLLQSIAGPIANRVTTYVDEADLGDGITLVPMNGHTPGHSGVRVTAKNSNNFLIVRDAIISESLQFENPKVRYALDLDPEQAIATRTSLLNTLAESGDVFSATHLTYPATGRVVRAGNVFRFEPLT